MAVRAAVAAPLSPGPAAEPGDVESGELPSDAPPVETPEPAVKSGRANPGEVDRVFWESVKKEAEGDVKLTFLSEKGFHHAWKSELSRLDGPVLMSIYESSKDFLNADPNQKFLDFPPPKGYDPLAMDRELRKSVTVIGELLAEKWAAERGSVKDNSVKP